ncbi:MAG: hypothetical protein IJP38_07685 [Oscillospiraceae bacterium]|nr:hypothetical protein [Oscillospiraceae bacterium]
MLNGKPHQPFSLLFFPGRDSDIHTMYVSTPPPTWLNDDDLTNAVITEEGIYCLFFLISSHRGGSGYITVNGREIRGSYAGEQRGAISGSAVCSIRARALPCSFGISTEGETDGGMLLIFKYDI